MDFYDVIQLVIRYRHFEKPDDIALQEQFWLEVTKNLSWPWKPNKTQEFFSKKDTFDPRSKYFAFEGENLVGYQSFVAGRDFIALGYPWIKDHAKKEEIQNELWNHTLEVLDKDFPNLYLLQRFRKEWTDHINFFLDRGFSLADQYPIFIHEIKKTYPYDELNSKITIDVHSNMQEELLRKVLTAKKDLEPTKISGIINSAKYLDYDRSIYLEVENKPQLYLGSTIRYDASYAEIALHEWDDQLKESDFYNTLAIQRMILELSNLNLRNVSMTLEDTDPIIPILQELDFSERSKIVFVRLDR